MKSVLILLAMLTSNNDLSYLKQDNWKIFEWRHKEKHLPYQDLLYRSDRVFV